MFRLSPSLYSIKLDVDSRLKELVDEARTKVSRHFDIPKYSLNSDVKIANLPDIYEARESRIGDYVVKSFRRVGKCLGLFVPYLNKIFIDPVNAYLGRLKKTITHETVHKAQDVMGKTQTQPTYKLEEEAERVTEQLA